MLNLMRRAGEQIMVGDDIIVTVVSIQGRQIKIGVTAPREVAIRRGGAYEKNQGQLPEQRQEQQPQPG